MLETVNRKGMLKIFDLDSDFRRITEIYFQISIIYKNNFDFRITATRFFGFSFKTTLSHKLPRSFV
jgi:hypothetical protein